MISKVTLVVLGLAAVVAADSFERYAPPRFSSGSDESYEYAPPRPRYSSGSSEESYESSEARYNFNYNVNHDSSENFFGHQEARDEDNTQGAYFVNLPDGRRQTVTFHVDGDDGYVAEVAYSGEAQFPSSESYESGSFESREAPRRFYSYDSNESK